MNIYLELPMFPWQTLRQVGLRLIFARLGSGNTTDWPSFYSPLFALNAISARLFILFSNRMAYDDQHYLADVHRYDSEEVSANGIRAHINPASPTGFVLDGSGGSHISRLTSCRVRAAIHKLASSGCRDPARTDRTNAGEDPVLSLISINRLELQMRNVLSHG
jgi:hypothetical protein